MRELQYVVFVDGSGPFKQGYFSDEEYLRLAVGRPGKREIRSGLDSASADALVEELKLKQEEAKAK